MYTRTILKIFTCLPRNILLIIRFWKYINIRKNRKLPEMTREECKGKVTKEFIENNRKVINQLKDNYNI